MSTIGLISFIAGVVLTLILNKCVAVRDYKEFEKYMKQVNDTCHNTSNKLEKERRNKEADIDNEIYKCLKRLAKLETPIDTSTKKAVIKYANEGYTGEHLYAKVRIETAIRELKQQAESDEKESIEELELNEIDTSNVFSVIIKETKVLPKEQREAIKNNNVGIGAYELAHDIHDTRYKTNDDKDAIHQTELRVSKLEKKLDTYVSILSDMVEKLIKVRRNKCQ